MKILFIGDIFAKSGRKAIIENLLKIKKELKIDFCIANAENATHGRSISLKHYNQITDAGVDFITMGNHTWENEDIFEILETKNNIIRPYNINNLCEYHKIGSGSKVVVIKNKKIRITNLLGLTCKGRKNFQSNPFLLLEQLIAKTDQDIHIIDFHTETTSEKKALLIQFNSRVSAIIGTHTHVPTADEIIYNDTAFITDVGMTGPINSIIGAKPETIIDMFNERIERFKLEPATGDYVFNSVILEFDESSNKPIKISRLCLKNN